MKVMTEIGAGATADDPRLGYPVDSSLYGGGRVGSQITGGVLLSGADAERGPYALNNGYSSPTGSLTITTTIRASGSVGADGAFVAAAGSDTDYDGANMLEFDADLVSGSDVAIATIPKSSLTNTGVEFNFDDFVAITLTSVANGRQVRRLTREDPNDDSLLLLVVGASGSEGAALLSSSLDGVSACTAPLADNFDAGGSLGSVGGADRDWETTNHH